MKVLSEEENLQELFNLIKEDTTSATKDSSPPLKRRRRNEEDIKKITSLIKFSNLVQSCWEEIYSLPEQGNSQHLKRALNFSSPWQFLSHLHKFSQASSNLITHLTQLMEGYNNPKREFRKLLTIGGYAKDLLLEELDRNKYLSASRLYFGLPPEVIIVIACNAAYLFPQKITGKEYVAVAKSCLKLEPVDLTLRIKVIKDNIDNLFTESMKYKKDYRDFVAAYLKLKPDTLLALAPQIKTLWENNPHLDKSSIQQLIKVFKVLPTETVSNFSILMQQFSQYSPHLHNIINACKRLRTDQLMDVTKHAKFLFTDNMHEHAVFCILSAASNSSAETLIPLIKAVEQYAPHFLTQPYVGYECLEVCLKSTPQWIKSFIPYATPDLLTETYEDEREEIMNMSLKLTPEELNTRMEAIKRHNYPRSFEKLFGIEYGRALKNCINLTAEQMEAITTYGPSFLPENLSYQIQLRILKACMRATPEQISTLATHIKDFHLEKRSDSLWNLIISHSLRLTPEEIISIASQAQNTLTPEMSSSDFEKHLKTLFKIPQQWRY
ncbi:hypothetical protein [Candidatus Odyssella acanthamoebae]|uniref:Uncharacterized protein n=1 Tax=Candidatus Odyssella acanthamoebae TaxID=91604 RepID=A0A077ATN5_9PROT|nr:hypothetical protein [Candidatus Paracaedibacter acanthamoebae]AIK96537.1 hypothetical protein ID47_06955 [Candidatus Paracaedibacter acanthamoebae]